MRTVTFDKSKGSLGLRLKSDEEKPGVFVLEKVAGGQGAAEDNIREGDYIHKVNDQDVTALSHEEVVQAIIDAKGDLALTVSATPPGVETAAVVETKGAAAAQTPAAPVDSSTGTPLVHMRAFDAFVCA
jgi:C-terminal processing protease CtpA/Prc